MTTTIQIAHNVWAVTCPGDPYEERPAHFIAADALEAIARYAECYRGGVTRGVEALALDLEALALEAADAADAADLHLASEGDAAAMQRVCAALG